MSKLLFDLTVWVQTICLVKVSYKMRQTKSKQWSYFAILGLAVGSFEIHKIFYWLHIVALGIGIYLCFRVLYEKDKKTDSDEVYKIIHDLQAPVRSINNLLIRLSNANLSEKDLENIDKAFNAVEQIRILIKKLLPERSENKNFQIVNLYEIIDGVCGRTTAWERYSTLNFNSPYKDAWVKGDAFELGQVLQNLIGNASKYTPQERIPKINIEIARDGKFWICSVIDNGIGVPFADREKIFDNRARLDTEQQYGGSGFGLSICKRILESHEGSIWLDKSEINVGSTFKFKIPVSSPPLNN